MAVSAADVKKLRDATDAPMGECKAALEEAGGDFDRAVEILREKGKAAAGKRAGRETGEGIAKFVVSADRKTAAGIVLECETDFVARNESFIALADKLANAFLATDPGSDPTALEVDGKTVAVHLEEAVAVIRENIRLVKATRFTHDGTIGTYNHHDGKKACAVLVTGEGDGNAEAANNLAMQVVAIGAEYATIEQVPADKLETELRLATERTQNETPDKPANIIENIAKGRMKKEFLQVAVLSEQVYVKDGSKSIAQYVKETAGDAKIVSFTKLTVGASGE